MRLKLGIAWSLWVVSITVVSPAQAQTSGHDVGDCLVFETYGTCRSFLSKAGPRDGINYLTEEECPRCLVGMPIGIDPLGQTAYSDPTCQEGKSWSKPNTAELDTQNPYYVDADGENSGQWVMELDERLCWQGGDCLAGTCQQVPCGLTHELTGTVLLDWQCHKMSYRYYYVIKHLGGPCDDPNQGQDDDESAEQTSDEPGDDLEE